MKKISLLIPAFNEEAVLPMFYERVIKLVQKHTIYDWEILFVNDGSSDNTLNIIKEFRSLDKRFHYVDFTRNFGKEIAMMAGLDDVQY
jgi:glycosyltransferase involved in cell wall biosynthesis